MLGADAAMLVFARVLLTFLSAKPTGDGAGLHGRNNRSLVAARAPRSKRTSCQTHVGAVKVQADALSHLSHHLFGKTCVRARGARLGTRVALLYALDQRVIRASGYVWMGSDHLSHVVHGRFLSTRRAPLKRNIIAGPRFHPLRSTVHLCKWASQRVVKTPNVCPHPII